MSEERPLHLGHSPDKQQCQGAAAIARYIGVSRRTILRWKKAGAPIYLIGGKYQCRYDDLWAWIAAHETTLYQRAEKR